MMHKISFSYKTTCANCHMPSRHWKQLMPHCSKTELLAGVIHEQDCRAIRTACCCLNSLRIRVEARANVTERAVISRQLQLMQASVQSRPTEDLNTADTSCPSRTSAEHFDDKPGPCSKNWTLQKIFALLTQAAFFESLPNISLKSTVFAGGASRLQACINAVELAIIANSIALDTVLKAVCTTRVLCSSQWRWCSEKNYWADSECALNAVATAVILTLDHVSPPVWPFFVSHHSRCDTASSLFASKCLGECYAGMAALCDLWDPGWGDPRFPHWALLLLSPSCMAPLCFSGLSLFCFFFWPYSWWRTRCHRASHFSELVAIPLLCVLFGFWCCCVLVCFVCLFAFFGLFCVWWDCSLDCVLVHYQRFWGYRRIDGLAW